MVRTAVQLVIGWAAICRSPSPWRYTEPVVGNHAERRL